MNYIPNISKLNKQHADFKQNLIREKENQYQKDSQEVIKAVKEKIPMCIEEIENFYTRNGHFPTDVTDLYQCQVDYKWDLSKDENYKRFKQEVKNIYGDNVNIVRDYGDRFNDPKLYVGIKPDYF